MVSIMGIYPQIKTIKWAKAHIHFRILNPTLKGGVIDITFNYYSRFLIPSTGYWSVFIELKLKNTMRELNIFIII